MAMTQGTTVVNTKNSSKLGRITERYTAPTMVRLDGAPRQPVVMARRAKRSAATAPPTSHSGS